MTFRPLLIEEFFSKLHGLGVAGAKVDFMDNEAKETIDLYEERLKKAVLSNPAVEVIKHIPAVWDETMVLPGSEIGELSLFARRSGTAWCLAVMCGAQGRTIQVPLGFLGEGQYEATLVRDDAVVVEARTARPSDDLAIQMRNGGGFVAWFVRSTP